MTPASLSPTSSPAPTKASRRLADRDRKRRDREAMRTAGIPDPRMLDAAIVDALRDLVVASGRLDATTTVSLREVLRRASESLQGRTQQGIAIDRAAMHRAMADRLAPSHRD